jgi:hypothetical protein
MIRMFMRNKNGFYFFDVKIQPLHSSLRFPAGKPGINEHSFFFVTDIVTIAVAAAIE